MGKQHRGVAIDAASQEEQNARGEREKAVCEKGRTRRENMTKQQSGVGANTALRDALGGRWVG